MPLFLQLDLASLPESCPFRGHGLLQLFYCVSDLPPSVPCECDLQAWQPLSPGKLARAIEPGAGDFAEPTLPIGSTPFPSRIIVGWERFDDYPSAAEHERFGIEYDYDFSQPGQTFTSVDWREGGVHFERLREPKGGTGVAELISNAADRDKLAGWPMWVQGVEYPDCPRCGEPMTYIFQIDSNDHLPYMFGDVGCGHLTRCERHPDVLGFGWACS
jgi:hypothetical protein